MSAVKPGLAALRDMILGLGRRVEPAVTEAIDPARRKFMSGMIPGLAPTGNLPATIPAQPLEAHPEVLSRAAQGEGRAIQSLAQAAGTPAPTTQADLGSLLSQFTPSRRSFLTNAAGAASHLVMPSPLKLLQSTTEGMGKLKLELDPLELMKYSQKYMDRPVDGDFASGLMDEWYEGEGRKATVRDMLQAVPWTNTQDLLKDFGPTLKAMELEPTKQNMDSLMDVGDQTDFFHPNNTDAHFDDLKHVAQDYAAGDWQTADDYLEEKAKELKVPREQLEQQLGEYLDKVHGGDASRYIEHGLDENNEPTSDYIGGRRNLDDVAQDESYDRGYMDEAWSNLHELRKSDPKAFAAEAERLSKGGWGSTDEINRALDELDADEPHYNSDEAQYGGDPISKRHRLDRDAQDRAEYDEDPIKTGEQFRDLLHGVHKGKSTLDQLKDFYDSKFQASEPDMLEWMHDELKRHGLSFDKDHRNIVGKIKPVDKAKVDDRLTETLDGMGALPDPDEEEDY